MTVAEIEKLLGYPVKIVRRTSNMKKVMSLKCVNANATGFGALKWFIVGKEYHVINGVVRDEQGYKWECDRVCNDRKEDTRFCYIDGYKFEKLYASDCVEVHELDKILKSGDIIVREVTIKSTGKTVFMCDIALMDTEVGNVVRQGVTDVQGVVKNLDEYIKEWGDNIVKVVTPKHLAFWYNTAAFGRFATQDETRFGVHKVKWERKKVEPKEMTVAEIEKILGYEVKVVKEK